MGVTGSLEKKNGSLITAMAPVSAAGPATFAVRMYWMDLASPVASCPRFKKPEYSGNSYRKVHAPSNSRHPGSPDWFMSVTCGYPSRLLWVKIDPLRNEPVTEACKPNKLTA